MSSFLKSLLRRFRQPKTLATSEDATGVFLELFRGHGLRCALKDGWIVADSGGFATQARIFTHSRTSAFCSIQLDLEVSTPSGHRILESCGGFGNSMHAAIADAIRNFCDGTFHVIYSALTGQSCSHCEVETWEIEGVPRRIYISPTVCRGHGSPGAIQPTTWIALMARRIKESKLSPGLHWIRLYHFECPRGQTVNEVLLDNEPWKDLQTHLGSYSWPPTDSFYSVRIFLVIMDLPEAEAR